MKRLHLGLLGLLGLAIAAGCGDEEAPPTGGPVVPPAADAFLDEVHIFPYQLQPIPNGEMWDRDYAVQDTLAYDQDFERVRVLIKDGESFYSPIVVANWGLALEDNYQSTGHPGYLEIAIRHADRLLAEVHEMDGAYYFPYYYDFKLHEYEDPSDFIPAPWYSGLAQGRIIAMFVRLYHATGETRFLDAAGSTFQSFLRPSHTYEDFIVEVDKDGYYWIEEYPRPIPTQVLNGVMYALRGLYEYYDVTRDPVVERVIQATLTMLRHYLEDFREPGELSYYCLSHRLQIPIYHIRHIGLVENLFYMTGDEYFMTMARFLKQDSY